MLKFTNLNQDHKYLSGGCNLDGPVIVTDQQNVLWLQVGMDQP
jgi:hypothetical protein